MSYSYEETKVILRHPAIHAIMSRVVHGREIKPVLSRPWHFDGRDNPTGPFLLFAACIEKSVAEALATTPAGRDRERLLLVLNITEVDDPAATAKAVGTTCENYAVEMQFGEAGLRSYHDHKHQERPHAA